PAEKLDLDLVSRIILAARDEVDTVDVVVLPESAADESEISDLEALLERHGVVMLITGCASDCRRRGSSRATGCISVSVRDLRKGGPCRPQPAKSGFTSGKTNTIAGRSMKDRFTNIIWEAHCTRTYAGGRRWMFRGKRSGSWKWAMN
ncbi:MAG TPA: hypothetical protein VH139_07810, partial [Acidobacteriaceae bacterium]|nr:hypothetical protein [Acidobacteriaceae bacterium]